MILVDAFYWHVFKTTKDKELQKKILRSNFICYVRFVYETIFQKNLKGFGYDVDKGVVEYGYACAKFLEDSYKLQCVDFDELIVFNIINIPPRFGKTETIAVFHSWYIGRNPQSHFINVSYSEPLTVESCKKVKHILKDYNYRWLFPAVKIAKDCDTSSFFKTTEMGEYFSTGITGGVTGRGVGNTKKNMFRPSGFLGIDDPLKAIDWNSSTIRDAVNNGFKDALPSRFNTKYKFYVLSMQRLHKEDLCGYLDSNFPSAYKRKLILPALIKNLPLCRENCNEKFLKDMESENTDTFQSQYMQDPTIEGDVVFNVNKIHTLYKEPPKSLIFNSFTIADTSMTASKNSDFTVFGHFYVYAIPEWRDYWDEDIEDFRDKEKIVKLLLSEIYVTKLNAAHLFTNFQIFLDQRLESATVPPRVLYIETKVSGIGLFQDLQMAKQRGGKYEKEAFILQELGKERASKEDRFVGVSPYVEREQFQIFHDEGRLLMNTHSTTNYIKNHLHNISRTKNSGVKDDIADVITYGLANTFLRVMNSGHDDLGRLSFNVTKELKHKILQERQFSHRRF